MKYVYVLVSGDTDFFYEQCYLSLASLRIYNPTAEVILLVDTETKAGLSGRRSGCEKLASSIITVSSPNGLTRKETSRFIKTSMRRYIEGNFLYIDCDTVICGSLDCDFPENIIIGAIPDCHVPLREHHYYRQFVDENLRLGFDFILTCSNYYNGGIIYCKDTPESHSFFEKWHALWNICRKEGNSQDMPSFNRANYELHNMISEIGGEWNCQISNNGLPFLHRAKIIHYFATSLVYITSPLLLASEPALLAIRNTGDIPSWLYQKLHDAKSAFEPRSRIIADKDVLELLDGSIFSMLRRLKKGHKSLFNTLESMAYRLISLLKKTKF
ncbi:MAG: hypothetical protein LBQ46_09095 [Treponema sp.]|jgi:hypothetical protein|nr:hypothetical protein [Treponema sp.]